MNFSSRQFIAGAAAFGGMRIFRVAAGTGALGTPKLKLGIVIQHPHPKDTCYGPRAWGHDDGTSTAALSPFPNAVALTGHSHYALTEESSTWQGAFAEKATGRTRTLTLAPGVCCVVRFDGTPEQFLESCHDTDPANAQYPVSHLSPYMK